MDPQRRSDGIVTAAGGASRGRFHWPTLAADAALASGGALVANILNYVYQAAMGRALGPEGYGSLATLFAIVMIGGVGGSAVGTVAMQETARRYARGQDASIVGVVRSMLSSVVGIATIVGLTALLIAIPLSRYLHIVDVTAWVLLAVMLFGGFVSTFGRGAVQGAHRFGVYAASMISESVLKLAFGFGLATAGFGLAGAMGGAAIGIVAGASIALVVVLGGRRATPDGSTRVAYGGAALRLAVIYGASNALLYVDTIFAKHALSGIDAGFYSAAGQMARIIPFGVGLTVPLITPKAVAASHAGRRELLRLLAATFGIAIAGALLVLGAMELWPSALIAAMFGGKYPGSAPLLRLYALDGMLLAAGLLGSSYLAAMGEYAIVSWLVAAVVCEALAMAAFGHSAVTLLCIAIGGNAVVLAPIVAYVASSVRRVPQAASPQLAEDAASIPH